MVAAPHHLWLVPKRAADRAESAILAGAQLEALAEGRVHPRAVVAGELGRGAAVGLGVAAFVAAIGLTLLVGDLVFTLLVTAFIVSSLAYSAGLKQVPVLEIAVVASGFLLRALGEAAASHIPRRGGSRQSAPCAPCSSSPPSGPTSALSLATGWPPSTAPP